MIPQNLLGAALSIIGKQSFQYVRVLPRSINSVGMFIESYATPVNVMGSVQAIPRNLNEQYGLDFQASLKTFYISQYVNDIHRNTAGDRFYFAGEIYQALSETDWVHINGWTGVVCVHIPGGCPAC
jgi:hypothetical protein